MREKRTNQTAMAFVRAFSLLSSRLLVASSSSSSSSISFSSRLASTSSLYDLRRARNRQGWQPPENPDPDYFLLPSERHGKTYALNYSLNALAITPQNDAYRNLFPRGLQYLSKEKLNENKATIVKTSAVPVKVFGLAGTNASLTPETSLSIDQFKPLFRQMRMYFSDIENIFVNDGSLGTSPSARLATRFVSDSAETSLFLHHLLPRLPLGDPFYWKSDAVVYICKELPLDSAVSQVVGKSFAAVDFEKGNVLFHGVSDFSQVQDVLAKIFPLIQKSDVDVLKSDARVVNGKVSLVFHEAGQGDGYGSKISELYGSRHVVLSSTNTSRLWDGVSTSSSFVTPQRGDVINGSRRTVSVPPKGNELSLPSAVFILQDGGKAAAVEKVSQDVALKVLKEKALVSGSGQSLAAAMAKVKEFYTVNVTACSEEELNRLLNNPEVFSLFLFSFFKVIYFSFLQATPSKEKKAKK